MKKIVFTLLFLGVILLGGMVYVSANMIPSSDIPRDNKVDYNVSIQLQKGWNLIVGAPMEGVYSGDDYADDTILFDSEIKRENIKAEYYYSRIDKKYLQIYPNAQELSNYLVNYQQNSQEILYFAQSPVWLYSDKTGTLKYARHDFPKFDNSNKLSLISGWNFVSITPEMVGKTMNEFKGTCTYSAIYSYGTEGGITGWGDLLNNPNFVDKERFDGKSTGIGLLIKVPSDCTLGSSSGTIAPPPFLPGCVDSDNGENYIVKGYVNNQNIAGGTIRKDDTCTLSRYNSQNSAWDYQDVSSCSADTNNNPSQSNNDRCLVSDFTCPNEGEGAYQHYKYCPNGCSGGLCNGNLFEDLRE